MEDHSKCHSTETVLRLLALCPCLRKDAGDNLLGFVLDFMEVVFAQKTFGVDFVDVFGSGGPGGEPAVCCHHFKSADGLAVGGSGSEHRFDFFASQFGGLNLLGREPLKDCLLLRRGGNVDALVGWCAEFVVNSE